PIPSRRTVRVAQAVRHQDVDLIADDRGRLPDSYSVQFPVGPTRGAGRHGICAPDPPFLNGVTRGTQEASLSECHKCSTLLDWFRRRLVTYRRPKSAQHARMRPEYPPTRRLSRRQTP